MDSEERLRREAVRRMLAGEPPRRWPRTADSVRSLVEDGADRLAALGLGELLEPEPEAVEAERIAGCLQGPLPEGARGEQERHVSQGRVGAVEERAERRLE